LGTWTSGLRASGGPEVRRPGGPKFSWRPGGPKFCWRPGGPKFGGGPEAGLRASGYAYI